MLVNGAWPRYISLLSESCFLNGNGLAAAIRCLGGAVHCVVRVLRRSAPRFGLVFLLTALLFVEVRDAQPAAADFPSLDPAFQQSDFLTGLPGRVAS